MKQRGVFSLLALSTVGSLSVATGSVLVLGPEDRISVTRGVFLTIFGLIFFLSLFDFLNHVALKTNSGLKIRKKYQLTMSDVLDISNKVVSAVQAALSCVTGAIVCMWSCTRSFLHSSHFMSEAYAWFGAAYFFYDIWSMYKVHISMLSGVATIHTNEKIAAKNSQGYEPVSQGPDGRNGGVSSGDRASNDYSMVNKTDGETKISFFSYCKDQPIIIMHHLFIGGFGFLVIVAIGGLPTGCKISICILLFPQFYWFYLMMSGAMKVFCVPKTKSTETATIVDTGRSHQHNTNGSSSHSS